MEIETEMEMEMDNGIMKCISELSNNRDITALPYNLFSLLPNLQTLWAV